MRARFHNFIAAANDNAMNSSIEESPFDELDMSRHIIGENASSLSLHDLRVLSRSDSVSVDSLRERLSRLQHQVVDMSPYRILLVDICTNARVTLEMVQCVIEYIPGAARAIDATGATPLHHVCANKNATLDIVRCVYEGCQEAILVKDEAGQNPLLYLCSNDELDEAISMGILTLLLEKCPESVQCCTHEGILPILLACGFCSPGFCCVLIEAFPESARHVFRGDMLLFLISFSSEVDDSVALAVLKLLLEKRPEIVRRVRKEGLSLLHYAATDEIPRALEICRLLIKALPELVLEHDDEDGFLPLHFACAGGSLPVVKYILDMCPDAIRGVSRGIIGAFPIHAAVGALRRYPEAAVRVSQYLLTVDPSVASQSQVDGDSSCLPLFLACSASTTNDSNLSAGFEVIKSLYNAYPEAIVNIDISFRQFIRARSVNAVQDFLGIQFRYAAQAIDRQLVITPDENGSLPIHNALNQGAILGSIKLLVKADVSTVLTPDSSGSLPLHIECERHGRPNVCRYLLDLHSDKRSLLVADNQGNTPLHCACRGANYDVIALLLAQYPTASVAMRNAKKHLPIQLLLANNHFDQDSVGYVSSIFLLLRANPGELDE
jgi:ankyrin repeat protein